MWAGIACVLSLTLAGAAWARSRAPGAGFYEGDVYHLDAVGHRRYALVFAALALVAGAAIFVPAIPLVPLAAILALAAIFYGATFLRGASGEDE